MNTTIVLLLFLHNKLMWIQFTYSRECDLCVYYIPFFSTQLNIQYEVGTIQQIINIIWFMIDVRTNIRVNSLWNRFNCFEYGNFLNYFFLFCGLIHSVLSIFPWSHIYLLDCTYTLFCIILTRIWQVTIFFLFIVIHIYLLYIYFRLLFYGS